MGQLQKDIIGQSVLNDWYEQRNNEATIQGVEDLIRPTQEMRHFQRRIRTLPKTVGAIATLIGEFGLMSGVVPAGETWRVLFAAALFTDATTTTHNIILRVVPATPGDTAYVVASENIGTGINTPLYPSSQISIPGSNGRFSARAGPELELFPGDTIQIFDLTPVGAATGTFAAIFRYEVMPPPVRLDPDEIITVTS